MCRMSNVGGEAPHTSCRLKHACQRLIRTLPFVAILCLALAPAMTVAVSSVMTVAPAMPVARAMTVAPAMPVAPAQEGAGGKGGARRGAKQQGKHCRHKHFQHGLLHRCFFSCGPDMCAIQWLCLHAGGGSDVPGAHSCVWCIIISKQDVFASEETMCLCLRGALECSGVFPAAAYRKGTTKRDLSNWLTTMSP